MISSGLLYCGAAEGDADARRGEHFAAADRKRRAQRLLNPERDGVGLLLVAEPVQQNRELVAAQPRERVALPQARLEAPRHRDEQLVADQVAEAVVDDLEAIEVEIEHREPVAAAPLLELLEPPPEPLHEHRAVAQPGQRIEEPGAAELLLCDRALGRVGQRSGDAGRRAGRRRAPRHRGTGTAGRCRPRGGSGARAESDSVLPERCASSASFSGTMSSAWTRSSHSSGRPMPAVAGRPIIALHRAEK